LTGINRQQEAGRRLLRSGTALTVVSARNTATSSAGLTGAGVLLEARVCDAASAGGNRAALVLSAEKSRIAPGTTEVINIDNAGRDGGDESHDGSERELHDGESDEVLSVFEGV
jgi:hypothetical protein